MRQMMRQRMRQLMRQLMRQMLRQMARDRFEALGLVVGLVLGLVVGLFMGLVLGSSCETAHSGEPADLQRGGDFVLIVRINLQHPQLITKLLGNLVELGRHQLAWAAPHRKDVDEDGRFAVLCVCVGGQNGRWSGEVCAGRENVYELYKTAIYKTQHLWRVGRHELQSAAVWDSSELRDRHFGDRHFGDRNFGDRNFGDRNLRELAYLDRFLELGCVHLAHGTAVDGGVSVEGANPSERKPNRREPSDQCRGSEQEQEA